jgi:hypothetical protein
MARPSTDRNRQSHVRDAQRFRNQANPQARRANRARVSRGLSALCVVLLSLECANGCSQPATPLPVYRGVCGTRVPDAACDQSCQDNNVGYALDHAGWLLYNQDVAGMPSGALNKTASCPLGGTVAITGTVTVASNGVNATQLAFSLANCGVSATSYSLTLTGTLQMNGTFTANAQNDITFSSSSLSIAGQLKILDNPTVNETCAMSMTDTWNYQPNDPGWLNGTVCDRSADGTLLFPKAAVQPVPDWNCLLESMQIRENGRLIALDDVPDSALSATDTQSDGGASGVESLAPELTSATRSLSFTDGSSAPLDLAFTDPTASRPAFFMTLRPHGPVVQCIGPCCWGCRATHRVFDKQTSGVVHYEATTTSDPLQTGGLDLIVYPVSCAEPGVDPVTAINSGAGSCTLLTGTPMPAGVSFLAPAGTGASTGGSSTGGGSGSAGGPSSGTPFGTCSTDTQCTAASLCGSNPGAKNNGGVCDVRATGDGLCHCCYEACGVDIQTGITSNCKCFSCNSDSDCSQLAYPSCVSGVCISSAGLPPP